MELLELHLEPGSPPVLHVQGEIDLATADELRAALEEALSADPALVLDLAGVTFIDLIGLRAVLEPAASLNGQGPLSIVNAPVLTRLLTLVHLSAIPSIAIREEA
jgi:anti-anti-sigma factor